MNNEEGGDFLISKEVIDEILARKMSHRLIMQDGLLIEANDQQLPVDPPHRKADFFLIDHLLAWRHPSADAGKLALRAERNVDDLIIIKSPLSVETQPVFSHQLRPRIVVPFILHCVSSVSIV